MRKMFMAAMLAMVMAFGATAPAMAMNYNVPQEMTDQQVTKTKVEKSKQDKKEKQEVTSYKTRASAGIQMLGMDSIAEIMRNPYGSKANISVVGELRNEAANVVAMDRLEGKIGQYSIENRVDFVDFMWNYTNQCMFLMWDSAKAGTGLQYAQQEIANYMTLADKGYNVCIDLRPVEVKDFTDEEAAIALKYVQKDAKSFYCAQVIVTVTQAEGTGSVAVNSQPQTIVTNGKSELGKILEDVHYAVSTYDLLKRVVSGKYY